MPLTRKRLFTSAAISAALSMNGIWLPSQAWTYATRSAPHPTSLAARLHLRGLRITGNASAGTPRPWAIVASGAARAPGGTIVLRFRGRILSASPSVRPAEFHYFDLSTVPSGRDAYHGPDLTARQAASVAATWLRSVDLLVPASRPRIVRIIGGATYIGGTGLCCFALLYAVHWDGRASPGSFGARQISVYVADAGTVVQVDVVPDIQTGRLGNAACRVPARIDRNGVRLGPRCFSYASVAQSELSTYLGGHHPQEGSPQEVARSFVIGSYSQASAGSVALRLTCATPTRRAYLATYRGERYAVVITKAFPRLAASEWALTDVAHAHRSEGCALH